MGMSSRMQSAQRSRTGSRSVCGMIVATLVLCWQSTQRRGVDTAAIVTSGDSKENVVAAVLEALPGSMPSFEVFSALQKVLKPYGVKPNNVIFGTSACPDELNNMKGQLSVIMSEYFGNVFPMGGLGGVPFAGKTGFGAFSAHVPDDGHVVVMFGPHIGFSPSAEAGRFLRPGQIKVSSACGALTAAYNQIGEGTNFTIDPQDTQQAWLRAKMAAHYEAAANSSNPMVEWVQRAYQVVEEEMLGIVNTNFGTGNLVLLGGISVNMPYPSPGYFLPLHFSVRSASADPIDLMPYFEKLALAGYS